MKKNEKLLENLTLFRDKTKSNTYSRGDVFYKILKNRLDGELSSGPAATHFLHNEFRNYLGFEVLGIPTPATYGVQYIESKSGILYPAHASEFLKDSVRLLKVPENEIKPLLKMRDDYINRAVKEGFVPSRDAVCYTNAMWNKKEKRLDMIDLLEWGSPDWVKELSTNQ